MTEAGDVIAGRADGTLDRIALGVGVPPRL